jgi:hypothetical protein
MTSTAQADYEVSGGGTLFILTPLNNAAKENLEAGVGEEAQWWAGGVAVEQSFISGLVEQLRGEGWGFANEQKAFRKVERRKGIINGTQ